VLTLDLGGEDETATGGGGEIFPSAIAFIGGGGRGGLGGPLGSATDADVEPDQRIGARRSPLL
jgi:hypothetical protein